MAGHRLATGVIILFFATILLASSPICAAQSTPSPLPSPTGYVNDYANVIDTQTKQRMEEMLTRLNEQQQIEYSVVTVPTTGDQDIFDYSLAVMRGWGIGSVEKPGLLTLVAINDRKYFTQVSRHLEGDLPDGLVGQVQRDNLIPAFKRNDYSSGLLATAQAFIQTMGERRGFDPAPIIGSSGPTRPNRPARSTQTSGLSACGIIFIILIVFIFLILANRGRGGGSGCLNFLLLNALLNSGRGSSGWGGGGFGGGGGGFGGGGFGGFSGGGGDAGGGGAGGSW